MSLAVCVGPAGNGHGGPLGNVVPVDDSTRTHSLESCGYGREYPKTFFDDGKEVWKVLCGVSIDHFGRRESIAYFLGKVIEGGRSLEKVVCCTCQGS